jgi:sterol desaturase/sphingolipid hydroxylase (fatty acid hydroxylase superfamily)
MLEIFLHIIFYDLWFYATHVILHHPKLYFIHKIHHRKNYRLLYYLDANDGHVLEHVIQPLGIFIPCLIQGFSTSALVISFIIVGLRGFMRHDDRFSWLIGNHHLLHHKCQKYNFGEYWIDGIFGTIYPNKNEYIYGIIYT